MNRSPDDAQRVAVIIGEIAQTGRAVAHRFAAADYAVGLIGIDDAALQKIRKEIEALGGRAATAVADITDFDSVVRAIDQLEAELGPVEVWVNDAADSEAASVAQMTAGDYRRVMESAYLGFVHGALAALRSMRPRNRGRIIQIGWAAAQAGAPLQSAYCGAQHAVRGFIACLGAELKAEGLQVSAAIIDLPAVEGSSQAQARVDRPWWRPASRPIGPEAVASAVLKAAEGRWSEYRPVASSLTPKAGAADSPFGSSAGDGAMLAPAALVRAGVLTAGAAAIFGLGAAIGLSRTRSRPH